MNIKPGKSAIITFIAVSDDKISPTPQRVKSQILRKVQNKSLINVFD